MSENKEAIFLLCIVAWGLVLVINVQSDAVLRELFIFPRTTTGWILEDNLWLRSASIEPHVTDASLIRSRYKCQMCLLSWLWYQVQQFTLVVMASAIQSSTHIKRDSPPKLHTDTQYFFILATPLVVSIHAKYHFVCSYYANTGIMVSIITPSLACLR